LANQATLSVTRRGVCGESKPGSTDGPGRVALGRVILIVGAVGML
jgi:hypothetical protein